MVLAALSFAAAALGTWAHAGLTVGLVISAPAMLVALLSLSALLAPSVVAAAIALVVTRPAHTHMRQRTNRRRCPGERSFERSQPRSRRGGELDVPLGQPVDDVTSIGL
jgi:hypothetical protein